MWEGLINLKSLNLRAVSQPKINASLTCNLISPLSLSSDKLSNSFCVIYTSSTFPCKCVKLSN